ncbi:MAG: hypothetical protein HOW73_26380 [Polyangiaceae bacterium]|nr:hypothetical protein [Polyangiaceae bacterium]
MRNAIVPVFTSIVSMCGTSGCEKPTAEERDVALARAAGADANTVARIVDGYCDREARCGEIGPDQRFADDDACKDSMRRRTTYDLSADECPGGVDEGELSECLARMQNENCESARDKLARITACRTGALCQVVPRM